MRRTILTLAVAILCGTAPLVSQAPPGWPHPMPHRPIGKLAGAQAADPVAVPAVFDATALGSPLTLDNGWRVGITASESPAQPGFDDSHWAVRAGHGVMDDVPDLDIPEQDQPPHPGSAGQSGPPPPPPGGAPGPNGRGRPYAWFRLHVKLAPNHGPVALLIELPVEPNTSLGMSGSEVHVEVFANGKRMSPGRAPRRRRGAQRARVACLVVQHHAPPPLIVVAPCTWSRRRRGRACRCRSSAGPALQRCSGSCR